MLTYKEQLTKILSIIKTHNSIIQKLANTSWGADTYLLRISILALTYPVTEYCMPVWLNSAHTSMVDIQLNCTMRIICGTVMSILTQWLSVLSNIASRTYENGTDIIIFII